jgi:hypothetical protein
VQAETLFFSRTRDLASGLAPSAVTDDPALFPDLKIEATDI